MQGISAWSSELTWVQIERMFFFAIFVKITSIPMAGHHVAERCCVNYFIFLSQFNSNQNCIDQYWTSLTIFAQAID